MSAQVLRDAAKVLRERAEAATPGPWHWESHRDDLPSLVGRGGDPATYAYDVEVIEADHSGECGCRSACHLSLQVRPEDQSLIATVHPGVGLALADLLESTADGLERRGITAHVKHAEATAIVLARLILGGAA